MFRFANPQFLWLLLLVGLYLLMSLRFSGRMNAAISYPLVGLVRTVGGRGASWKRYVRTALRAAVLITLLLALARPQAGSGTESVLTEGIDIMLAVDVSGSMRAEDFKPLNRLAVAKEVVAGFVEGRVSDRIGMVVFASQSFTQCPLTLDHRVLIELLESVEIGMIDEESTAIGLGVATATNRLRKSDAESRIIILLTDGRNNAGEIDPITAAQAARALGIKIYTVAVGTPEGGPIPVHDPVWGTRYVNAPTDIDEETLAEIADITGGIYFRAKTEGMLAEVYATIDELEKTKIEVKHFTTYTELGPRLIVLGLVLLLLDMLLSATLLRRLP